MLFCLVVVAFVTVVVSAVVTDVVVAVVTVVVAAVVWWSVLLLSLVLLYSQSLGQCCQLVIAGIVIGGGVAVAFVVDGGVAKPKNSCC